MLRLDPKAKWLFFLNNILMFAFVAFFIIIFFFSAIIVPLLESGSEVGFFSSAIPVIVVFILFDVSISYIWAGLSYRFYGYQLSDNGFKKESGVINKKYVTIPYDRIQNVDIYRGILARILGLSDLHIQTAGMSYTGKYGAVSEGRLPGLSVDVAEKLRDELVLRAVHHRKTSQGL